MTQAIDSWPNVKRNICLMKGEEMKAIGAFAMGIFAIFFWAVTGAAMIGLFGMLGGCGSIEYPKTEVKQAPADSQSDKKDIDIAGGATQKEGIPEARPSSNSIPGVSVDVQVTINIDDKRIENGLPIFSAKEMQWKDALDSAPEGYHLATRAEATAMLDDGILDQWLDENDGIWTATEDRQMLEMAWVMSLSSDFAVMKDLDFKAIFVAN